MSRNNPHSRIRITHPRTRDRGPSRAVRRTGSLLGFSHAGLGALAQRSPRIQRRNGGWRSGCGRLGPRARMRACAARARECRVADAARRAWRRGGYEPASGPATITGRRPTECSVGCAGGERHEGRAERYSWTFRGVQETARPIAFG
jgi:hypothetical protein